MGLASCIFIIPLKVSRELAKVRPGHHLDLCWDPQTPAVSCFQCQVTFPGYLFQQILQWVKKLWLLFFFFFLSKSHHASVLEVDCQSLGLAAFAHTVSQSLFLELKDFLKIKVTTLPCWALYRWQSERTHDDHHAYECQGDRDIQS